MLEYLHIKNLALIEDVSLDFSDGINVLTGETGAGKSFILKAINFLLGEKLPADMVRSGADKAQVEAIFHKNGEELIIRREMSQGGRSRLYINDSLASQETIRGLKNSLVSHTSQHAQQQLLNPAYQASMLQLFLEGTDLPKQKENLIQNLKDTDNKIKVLLEKQKNIGEKRELLELQAQEIEKVNPRPGEEEELEKLRKEAREKDNIKQLYNKLMTLLHGDGSEGLLQQLVAFERLIFQADDKNEDDLETVRNFRQFVSDYGKSFSLPHSGAKKIDMDAIEERLYAFAQLKRKLRRTYDQILSLQDEIRENLSFLDACQLDISRLEKQKKKLAEQLGEVIAKLEPLQVEAAEKFCSALEKQLQELGFSKDVKVIADFQPYSIWPGVEDKKGRLLWAPNPGQPPQPLDRIASGGELSRFLLALNTLADQDRDMTYIFDEVDAGVGGITLNKVGDKLASFAERRQIILITHWPQLAARAKNHFFINKTVRDGQTYTQCESLDARGKVAELTRMAGGEKGTALIKDILE